MDQIKGAKYDDGKPRPSLVPVEAIEAIMQGQRNVMVGVRNNEIVYVPLSEAIRSDKPFDKKLIKVLKELSI